MRLNPNAGALTYQHPLGFKLLIPASMKRHDGTTNCGCTITIGSVPLKLNHARRTVSGDIPASWLIELGATEEFDD